MGAALGALGADRVGQGAEARIEAKQRMRAAAKPVLIAAGNSYAYLNRGYELLKKGGDTLDAAIAVVRGPEDDPNDDSVGEGAERFAVARGFQREDLLTDASRKVWLLWKEAHSDWWGPGLSSPQWRERMHSDAGRAYLDRLTSIAADLGIATDRRGAAIRAVLLPPTGTTHCSALAADGAMSGCTTTSGLAWKIPGRLGDSPIIGAGCYTDQDVGSAGATGSGEENIKVAGAHTIVENMRRGMSPQEAGMNALERIVRNYNHDQSRLRFVDMVYYVLRKDGAYAGVSLWQSYQASKPHTIAVHDGTKRQEQTTALFKGPSEDYPPEPKVPPEVLNQFR